MVDHVISVISNVKMTTNAGILTFISIINKPSDSLKTGKVIIFQHFSFYEKLKSHSQSS